ncbi:hypothetical protein B0A49_07830 [Cryomyces minteri]|uniref:Uncharacterized protein n=1 Tax=Cryomyces minteri TaxID=331657 RepID=A0A4U0WU46_9PEZI|nr:hypothetical protein B0A49_07830 [Cryomyces minteri]
MDLRRRIRRPKRLVDDAAFMARGRCQSRPAVPAVCVPTFPIPFAPYNPEKVRSQPAAFPSLDITETVAQRQEREHYDLERKEREEAENEDGWGSSEPDDNASDRELVQRAIARAKRRRRREGGDLATVTAAEMAKIKHCKRSRQEALNQDYVALDLQDEEEEEPPQKAQKLPRPSSPNAQSLRQQLNHLDDGGIEIRRQTRPPAHHDISKLLKRYDGGETNWNYKTQQMLDAQSFGKSRTLSAYEDQQAPDEPQLENDHIMSESDPENETNRLQKLADAKITWSSLSPQILVSLYDELIVDCARHDAHSEAGRNFKQLLELNSKDSAHLSKLLVARASGSPEDWNRTSQKALERAKAFLKHRHLPQNFLMTWSQEETERIDSPVTQSIGEPIVEPTAINTPPEWPSKKQRKAGVGGSSPLRQPALNLRQMDTMLRGPHHPTFDSSEQEMPAPEAPARPRGRQPKVGANIPSRQPTLPLRSQQPIEIQEKPYIVHRTAELAIAASRAGSALTRGKRPPNTPSLPPLTFKSISRSSNPGTTTDMRTATSSTTVPVVKPTAGAKSTSPPPPKRRRTGKEKQTDRLPTPPITATTSKAATSVTKVPTTKPTASAELTSPPPPKRRRAVKGKQTDLLPTPPTTTAAKTATITTTARAAKPRPSAAAAAPPPKPKPSRKRPRTGA